MIYWFYSIFTLIVGQARQLPADILNTDIDSDVGYFLVADLEISMIDKKIFFAHPKENGENIFLSDFRLNLFEQMGVKNCTIRN